MSVTPITKPEFKLMLCLEQKSHVGLNKSRAFTKPSFSNRNQRLVLGKSFSPYRCKHPPNMSKDTLNTWLIPTDKDAVYIRG